MAKALIVPCHPRADSLTMAVAKRFCDHAEGVAFETADLYKEDFDPSLRAEDEPDWLDPNRTYSAAVQKEMARIERNDATVMVFPVWWWSMPAMLKGWVDRVFNHGWAYGGATYPHRDVWMLAIAGGDKEGYAKRRYDEAIDIQLRVGVLEYCGVERPHLEVLYGAIESEADAAAAVDRAGALGEAFAAKL